MVSWSLRLLTFGYVCFLSFTAYWISPEFKLQHEVLAIRAFPGSDTGKTIAREIINTYCHWNIDQSKIHLLIHHNGANIVKCMSHETPKLESPFISLGRDPNYVITTFLHPGLKTNYLEVVKAQ